MFTEIQKESIPERALNFDIAQTVQSIVITGGGGAVKITKQCEANINALQCVRLDANGKIYPATNKVDYIALTGGKIDEFVEVSNKIELVANLGTVGNLYLNYASSPNSSFYQKIGTQINSSLAIIDIGRYYPIL